MQCSVLEHKIIRFLTFVKTLMKGIRDKLYLRPQRPQ